MSEVSKKFIDLQIGGEIKSAELLHDLVENIRADLFANDSKFDGQEGLILLAQQIKGDAGHGSAIHIQTTINQDSLFSVHFIDNDDGPSTRFTALSEIHNSCVMGNLSYQILVADEKQEGYDTLLSWEPGTAWDDRQQRVDLVDEMSPAVSMNDLLEAQAAGLRLENVLAKLGAVTTVTIRHNAIRMKPGIFEELRETLQNEVSSQKI